MANIVKSASRDLLNRYKLMVQGEPEPTCYDHLQSPPTQLGLDLNECYLNNAVWNLYSDYDGNPPLPGVNFYNDICLHAGQLWVAHVDAVAGGTICGFFVKRWTGTTWENMAFPTITDPTGSLRYPHTPAIASDGESVYVAFVNRRTVGTGDFICPPPTTHLGDTQFRDFITGVKQRVIEVWKLSGGAWAQEAVYQVPQPDPPTVHPAECVGFYTNLALTITGPFFDEAFPGWTSLHLGLAARDGSHVVVWAEGGVDVDYCTTYVEAVVNFWVCQSCGVFPSIGSVTQLERLCCGFDGSLVTLLEWSERFSGENCNTSVEEGERAPTDFSLIWDDDAGPMLAYVANPGFPSIDSIRVVDPRDGSVYLTSAPIFDASKAVQISPAAIVNGESKRYLVAERDSDDTLYVMETNNDCTEPLGPLDGDEAYAVVRPSNVPVTFSHPTAIVADGDDNLWLGVGGADLQMVIYQFTRACPDDVPTERWLKPGVFAGTGGFDIKIPPTTDPFVTERAFDSKKLIQIDDAFYTSIWNRDIASGVSTNPALQQVWQIPILRCPTLPACGSVTCTQFPTNFVGTVTGPFTWRHTNNNPYFDRCEFYVDDVLVYTDPFPDTGTSIFWYGGFSPGTYDPSALTPGPHEFKTISISTEFGMTCEASATVNFAIDCSDAEPTEEEYGEIAAGDPLVFWQRNDNANFDYCEFYVDDVLVYTDLAPTVVGTQRTFYYGGSSPGDYDTSGFALGPHEFKSVSHSTALDETCENITTVTVVPPGWPHMHVSINGSEISDENISADLFWNVAALRVGSIFGSPDLTDLAIDAVKVGTTLHGTDLFSADFASTAVPPFDSLTGSGISVSGGQLVVSNAGTDAYAAFETPPWSVSDYPELYVEFKVTLQASMFDGQTTGDFVELLGPTDPDTVYAEVWADTGASEWRVYPGTADGTTLTSGVQYTVVIHLSQT